jgi:hypothetical protein
MNLQLGQLRPDRLSCRQLVVQRVVGLHCASDILGQQRRSVVWSQVGGGGGKGASRRRAWIVRTRITSLASAKGMARARTRTPALPTASAVLDHTHVCASAKKGVHTANGQHLAQVTQGRPPLPPPPRGVVDTAACRHCHGCQMPCRMHRGLPWAGPCCWVAQGQGLGMQTPHHLHRPSISTHPRPQCQQGHTQIFYIARALQVRALVKATASTRKPLCHASSSPNSLPYESR